MKSAIILVLVFITVLATACTAPAGSQKESSANPTGSNLKQLVLDIPTITCTSCRYRVEASAKSVSGVIDVSFDRKSIQRVTIVYDPAQTSHSAIIMSIEKKGDRVIELPQ